jgi:hypothetical protein
MDVKSKRPAVVGRVAQVDICPAEAGFVLSVGPVSLWLDLAVAEDVVETLSEALVLGAREGGRAAEPVGGVVIDAGGSNVRRSDRRGRGRDN